LSGEGKISVHVRYGDFEASFSGSLEGVWLSLNSFFGEFLPSFGVARRLVLSVDLQNLAKDCEGVVGFSVEGANVLVGKDRLTDVECLLLWLLAGYLGFGLGLLKSDVVGKEDLQARLGKSGKIVSTRLGELVKSGWVLKADGEGYRISTFGVIQVQKEVLPKIKAKVSG